VGTERSKFRDAGECSERFVTSEAHDIEVWELGQFTFMSELLLGLAGQKEAIQVQDAVRLKDVSTCGQQVYRYHSCRNRHCPAVLAALERAA
jgi:hypothetical protein